ncbi:MAG TPA: Rieske 2Fe-2S domain-containing protein [Ramlibacter sp.]|nr:Rieske 2Fe-2S domain-containing protein [Ramlibacter sp.]
MPDSIMHYRKWPEGGPTRIPSWIYSDEDVFRRELETFHYGTSWNYIGLECELPTAGSYKRTWIGPRNVLATRDAKGQIHVVENRCAHRDSQLTWKESGTFDSQLMICPYHNWTFELNGNLKTMPFIRGCDGHPGMPASFDKAEHGLTKLRVAVRGGAIWATYAHDGPSFEEFMGPVIQPWYDRIFNGRPLKLLGISRQHVPSNYKFYTDNGHDGYHAALLHTFIPKFGLWRPDGEYHQIPTEKGRHILYKIPYSPKLKDATPNDVTRELKKMDSDFKLADPSVITQHKDEFGDMHNSAFQLFPSAVVQQFFNSLTVRHIVPKSAQVHELVWNFFGYADDDAEMVQARMRHSNLVGPSGYISAEDTEIIAQLQPNVNEHGGNHVCEMGGHGTEQADTMISESPIRAFYDFYRREMRL